VIVSTARAALAALATLALSSSVSAQASNSDWDDSSNVCAPACRSGFDCRRGECTPSCTPACGNGFVCSEGSCVSAEPVSTAPARMARRREPAADSCEPGCRSGYTCIAARCVSMCNPICGADETCSPDGECLPAQSLPIRAPVDTSDERDSSADSVVNLHADIAGALQFGVTPTIEVGKRVSGYLQLRVMNAGLASYLALGRGPDDRFRLGIGAALGLHLFGAERGNMRGLYGGLAMEYVFVETRDDSTSFAEFRTHALIPQLDFGYRWGIGQLLVGVAVKLGLSIPISDDARAIGDMGCRDGICDKQAPIMFIPGLVLDLGWCIPNQ
jgi:hypothetical protein